MVGTDPNPGGNNAQATGGLNRLGSSHSQAGEDVVSLCDLTVEYPAHGGNPGHTAINGLNLRVRPGEVLGVIGEAGAGKSTLVRVLSGLSDPSNGAVGPRIIGGEAVVLGHSIRGIHGRRLKSLRSQLGLVPQNAGGALSGDATVGQLIAGPVYRADKRADVHATGLRVASLIDAMKLPLKVIDQYPYELTSGQRQRVAIARALVLKPRLLVTDDPTAGIDVSVREAIVELLGPTAGERAFAGVIVSNDLDVLRQVANRVAVVHQGTLVGLGPLDEVLRHPLHPYVAQIAADDQARQA